MCWSSPVLLQRENCSLSPGFQNFRSSHTRSAGLLLRRLCVICKIQRSQTRTIIKSLLWMIDHLLSLKNYIEYLCKRTKQIMYFPRHLRSFGASRECLLLFFTSVIVSVLQYCNTTWYKCLSTAFKSKLLHLLKMCSTIVGHPVRDFLTQQTIITWEAVQQHPLGPKACSEQRIWTATI